MILCTFKNVATRNAHIKVESYKSEAFKGKAVALAVADVEYLAGGVVGAGSHADAHA